MEAADLQTVRIVRLIPDESGESHFHLEDVERGMDSLAELLTGRASAFSIRRVPPEWERDWGPSENRTLAVYIHGTGVVEASDGSLAHVQPGVVLVAEDTWGRGHRAAVTGDQPLVVMHVTLSG